MKRAFVLLGYGLLIIVLVIASTLSIHKLLPLQPVGEIRYVDVITIVLTALSIMITVLGLFVAALGVIGWTTFESKIRDNSLSYLTSELSKDGKLRKEFEAILTELSLQGVRAGEVPGSAKGDSNSNSERPYND